MSRAGCGLGAQERAYLLRLRAPHVIEEAGDGPPFATSGLSRSTHYTAILNTAESNGYVPFPPVQRLDVKWGTSVIAQIQVIAQIIEEPEPERVGAVVRIDGSAYIIDDDTFGSNDTGSFPFSTTTEVGLSSAGLPTSEWVDPNTPSPCVDEVRVTLDVEVSYDPVLEEVVVSMPIELFEGSSCATTDLDGVGNLVVTVPVDGTRTAALTVTHTGDSSGGDSLTVTATVQATGIYE